MISKLSVYLGCYFCPHHLCIYTKIGKASLGAFPISSQGMKVYLPTVTELEEILILSSGIS